MITSAILQIAIIFYLTEKTGSAIKPEYLGRVFSLTGSIMSLAMPLGLILSGFFADRVGANHWFLISGVLIIGIAIRTY